MTAGANNVTIDNSVKLDLAIIELLDISPLSEFELIKSLQQAPYQIFNEDIFQNDLTKHKPQLTDEISTISEAPETEKLREYYLNWDNFNKTDENDVIKLIDGFWKKMSNINTYFPENEKQEISQALTVLELAEIPSKTELKNHYRKLCQVHHPDKGGDTATFQNMMLSYRFLQTVINAS